jgi:hypothetical protein
MTVTNKDFDLSANGDRKGTLGLFATESVTSTEQTLTVTPHPQKPTTIAIRGDHAFGISRATGAYAAKYPYTADTEYKFVVPADPAMTPIVLYWMASSTSAAVYLLAID